MKRKDFLGICITGGISVPMLSFSSLGTESQSKENKDEKIEKLQADLVIAGGGIGGCAAALSALRNNLKVILTEETDWIGGQLSQQGVPPDEHQWIETHGSTKLYRSFRKNIRDYYKKNYPVTDEAAAKELFNPGNSNVSRIGHEPRVSVAVLTEMFAPYLASGKLIILLNTKVVKAEMNGRQVKALTAKNLLTSSIISLIAPYFVDATELGDLLPMTSTAFVTGTESQKETGELHAPEKGDPDNNQSFTICFAMDYIPGENNVIAKPENYEFWRSFHPKMTPEWPCKQLSLEYSSPYDPGESKKLGFNPAGESTAPLLNLWTYRRIIDKNNFDPGFFASDIIVVNWPQNDFYNGNLVNVSEKKFAKHVAEAKQLNLSLLYWLQTEAPRPDGGLGWPGLRLRKDVMGTEDGMAKYPYIRESRRIKAVFTVLEEHVGKENRLLVAGAEKGRKAANFEDSVGIGYYPIDLHPSSKQINQMNLQALPFQIPLGALLPIETENLLPACKNIGTTHITNGCYRLHPVEWNIGESVGELISFAIQKKWTPYEIYENSTRMEEFQQLIQSRGIDTHWPDIK